MSSFIQFIKLIISGNTLKGIKFRTNLSIFLTVVVLLIEVVAYCVYWDSIPAMIQYDYDFDGVPHNLCAKQWIWANLLLQGFIWGFVFVLKKWSYQIKRVRSIVYDENNHLIPILDKRFSMFAWETAMLFVTTEQGYLFAISGLVKNPICDDIVTLIFLFWLVVLIIEFYADVKNLKAKNKTVPQA